MKILIAMDSFKGSLDSLTAAKAVEEGIRSVAPNTDILISPLADGGEGTLEALLRSHQGCEKHSLWVRGPLGRSVLCHYGVTVDKIAVIEIAQAAGLTLIPESQRNPAVTTTYGVGEMIRDAIRKGCKEFIIGLGGSGTNDGGVGMLEALGWRFLDAYGEPIPPGAYGLEALVSIDCRHVLPQLSQCCFRIACDVTNPLLGEKGCSVIFGPQKGATEACVKKSDKILESYSKQVQEIYPTADPYAPGSGAAGGLGFAFTAFLGGELISGAELLGDICRIEEKIRNADLIITGEGSFDGQTAMGKGPMYIARLGKKYRKPVLVLAGSIGKGAEKCLGEGVLAYVPILPRPMSLQEAIAPETAYANLQHTASQIYRIYAKQS